MSVPPEMMPPPGAPPPGAGAPPPEPGPAAGGIMTPQSPQGKIESAKVNVTMAVKVLTQTLSAFEPGSPEFKGVMGAIRSLEKLFGQDGGKSEELMPAEIKQLLQGLSGPGPMPGGPPGGPPGGGAPPPM